MKMLAIIILAAVIFSLILLQFFVISESLGKIMTAFGIDFGPVVQLASLLFLILVILLYARNKVSPG